MRKRLMTFVLLALLTVLVACEGGETEELTFSFPSMPTLAPLPPNASIAADIRSRGYLRVGVRYDDAPFGSIDDAGGLVGFDVDLAHEFAFRWLGDADAVKFVQVTEGSVNDRIKDEQVDLVIGALSPHQGTAEYTSFSLPYYYDGLSLLVRAGPSVTNTVPINGPGDLEGVAVAVVEESDTEAPLSRAAAPAVPQVIYYPDYFSAVAGLQNGVVQAVVGPQRTLMRLAGVSSASSPYHPEPAEGQVATDGTGGMGLTPRFTRDPYVIGLPQGDGAFCDLVNVTLMNMINDGTYHRFFQTWFPDQAFPELEILSGTSRLDFGGLSDTLGPSPGTIEAVEARGYVIAGLLDEQLPFSDLDANGVARGFEAELVRALVGRWLGSVTAVQFVRHSEASGVAALQTGQIDLLVGGLPRTLPREDDMDFSLTYYQDGLGLLVRAESGVNGVVNLDGGAVAVSGGSDAAETVRSAAAQAGVVVSLQTMGDVNTALAGVADGTYRAYVDWRRELLRLAYTSAGFVVPDQRLTRRPVAMGLRQGDGAFRDLVNLTLQELAAEGRFAALYDDWFGTDPAFPVEIWPGSPYRSLKLSPAPQAPAAEAP